MTLIGTCGFLGILNAIEITLFRNLSKFTCNYYLFGGCLVLVFWFCFFLILVHHKISNALNYAFGNSCVITFLLLIYISLIFQVNVYFIHIIDFKIFQKDQRNTRYYCEVIVFHQDLTRLHWKVILLLILSTKLAFTSYSIKKEAQGNVPPLCLLTYQLRIVLLY